MTTVSHTLIKNPGKYNKQITIFEERVIKDAQGFPTIQMLFTYQTWANVKTTRGMTIIANNSDFEKAYTCFTFRYPIEKGPRITRNMVVDYNGKHYAIEYVNNINEANIELELQCKEVTH